MCRKRYAKKNKKNIYFLCEKFGDSKATFLGHYALMPLNTVFPHIASAATKYSFLTLEIQKSQCIRPKVTVHKCGETTQG